MRVLLIGDDAIFGQSVRLRLLDARFVVDWVTEGRSAVLALGNGVYDAAVLDLGMPKEGCMALLTALRDARNRVPILIASARDTVRDRIDVLEAGADDYLTKPLDLDELVTRVRVLIRRQAGSGTPFLTYGAIKLDPLHRRVTQRDIEVILSPLEFSVLESLMRRPGAVLSRERLEDSVYGWGEEVASNAIEFHLHNLRRKLGTSVIKNVRGVGYRVTEG